MTGPDHYREGERLLEHASTYRVGSESYAHTIAAAGAHFAAAQVAATVEAADRIGGAAAGHSHPRLVVRPTPAAGSDPAYPGSPWGRALAPQAVDR